MWSPRPAVIATACLAAAGQLSWPCLALAHPLVDEGVRRVEDADFAGALQTFARAEQESDLGRADLIEILLNRAVVFHAIGNPEGLDGELLKLASLEPDYQFADTVPPPLRDAFARVRSGVSGPIRLNISHAVSNGTLRLNAQIDGDVAGLVRVTRFGVRPGGQTSDLRITEGSSVQTEGTAGEIEYFVLAMGPGGAPLSTLGSAEAPRTLTIHGEHPRGDSPNSNRTGLWVGLGVGVAAAVATAVLVVLLTRDSTVITEVEEPFIDLPMR